MKAAKETSVPLMANCYGVQEKSKDKRKYLRLHTKLESHNTPRIPHEKQNGECKIGDRKPSNMSDCMHERKTREKFKLR
jgi:hypothetical protein